MALGVFHCGAQNFDVIGGTADIEWPPAPIASEAYDPGCSLIPNQMTMTECLGVEGLYSAKEFVEKHPLYHTWQFKGWSCQIGNKPAPKRGQA
jgi:hypothetical protein